MNARSRLRRRLGLLAATVVVVGGITYLFYGGIGDNLVYYVTPSELVAQGEAAYESPKRLAGMVVDGTVEWDAEALDLRFAVADGEEQIAVHSRGAPPQMFREGIEVVIEGEYTRERVFESQTVMVMHSNEYRAAPEGERPADTYRSLIRETQP